MSAAAAAAAEGGSSAKRVRTSGAGAAAADLPAPSFLEDLEDMVADMDADDAQQAALWQRPPLPPINPATDRIVFQQLELDHYLDDPVPGMPGRRVLACLGVWTYGRMGGRAHGFLGGDKAPAASGPCRL